MFLSQLPRRLRPGLPPQRRCARPRLRAQRLDYKTAGVDIDAGTELVRRIQKLNPAIGGFNGLVPFGDSYLVAGTDGVGTKLKLAFELQRHDTIGIDLVAMSVNDILTSGAQPLFFLDYYATSHLDVDVAEQVVKGIVEGCRQSNCILLGGETAEMPGFYTEGEYDVAGFAVGAVKKEDLIDGKRSLKKGDVLIGLKSSGVHSNGFSLVRKIFELSGMTLRESAPWDSRQSMGDVLLKPTVIYVSQIGEISKAVGEIKGMVHVTGGGFPENLPRMCPPKLACEINTAAWQTPEIFQWLQKTGGVDIAEMYRTFNMGIGMVIAVDPSDVRKVLDCNSEAVVMGELVEGEGVIFK